MSAIWSYIPEYYVPVPSYTWSLSEIRTFCDWFELLVTFCPGFVMVHSTGWTIHYNSNPNSELSLELNYGPMYWKWLIKTGIENLLLLALYITMGIYKWYGTKRPVLGTGVTYQLTPRHRWASASILMSAISDIRHRHLLFRYRKRICRTDNCHYDIERVPISTSESIFRYPISKKYFSLLLILNQRPLLSQASGLPLSHWADLWTSGCRISDIGWKFIPISDIMSDSALFSPISEVPISSSLRYRWSRISEKVATYAPGWLH